MAEINVRNILVGAGNLFYTDGFIDQGPALPDFATSGFEDALDGAADWHYAGATQDGVELTYTPDYGEVEVDQMKGAAVMFNQSLTVTLGTNLAEAGLERLLLAWGVEDDAFVEDADVDTFSIGVAGDDPVERSVAVVGKGTPVNQGTAEAPDWQRRERLYHARRVVSVEGSTVALRKTEATTFPVSFRLLPQPQNVGSEYGVIMDKIPGAPA